MNRKVLTAALFALAMWLTAGGAHSADLVTIGFETGAGEAAENTGHLISQLDSGVVDFTGTGDFYCSQILAPTYRRLNTAYAVGDVIRGDQDKVYVCDTAGTTPASGIGPTGTGTNIAEASGTCRWDYVTACTTWDKRKGLSIVGPRPFKSCQHVNEFFNQFAYGQTNNLRLRFDGLNATDWAIVIHQDTATGWSVGTSYVIGDVVESNNGIYCADTAGSGGTAPTGTSDDTSFGGGTSRWDYIGPEVKLVDLYWSKWLFQIEGTSRGVQIGCPNLLSSNSSAGRNAVHFEWMGFNAPNSSPYDIPSTKVQMRHPSTHGSLPCQLTFATNANYNPLCEVNFQYNVDISGAFRGAYYGLKLRNCNEPVTHTEHMFSAFGLWVEDDDVYSPVPGHHWVVSENCVAAGVFAESGEIELHAEMGYPDLGGGLGTRVGQQALPAAVDWWIPAGTDDIKFDANDADLYLYPGQHIRLVMADGTPRDLIIETVGADDATFYYDDTYCYFTTTVEWDNDTDAEPGDDTTGDATVKTDATLNLIDGTGFVIKGSRTKLESGRLEVNDTNNVDWSTPLANLPVGIFGLGTEPISCEAGIGERGEGSELNNIRIAAHCAGTGNNLGSVQFAGAYHAAVHPLGFVVQGAAPANASSSRGTLPLSWGVGPGLRIVDSSEGLVPFKMVDDVYTTRINDYASGWRVPVQIPAAWPTDREITLYWWMLAHADADDTELELYAGNLGDSESAVNDDYQLHEGWQVRRGTITTDALEGDVQDYFRIDGTGFNVARVQVGLVPWGN